MNSSAVNLRVAMVTNIPAPYRLPVYEQLAAAPGIDFCAFFCSGREPDREWDLKVSNFKHVFLRETFMTFRGRFIHVNLDVWGQLRAFRPDVIVTTGFNPTHLLAYAYASVYGARHVAMTDGTLQSETALTRVHHWVRQVVYAGTKTFIGASNGTFELYRSYGIDPSRMFKSHLCANNNTFFNAPPVEKRFDLIFCGRFVAMKNPLFAIEVARSVSLRLGRQVSILFVGSGEMEPQMRTAAVAAAEEVKCVFPGFARQDELPQLYGSAQIFLFPTQWDVWGVVANEACAAGLPVLVSPFAGSAGELIRDGENGFVLPLNIEQWADAAVRLLSDKELYVAMSARSRALVQEYSFENAAAGIANGVRASAVDEDQSPPTPRRLTNTQRPKVVIIQRRMTHYRVPLFELMRDKLENVGVELTVVFGDPTPAEQDNMDAGTLPWGVYVPCTYWLNGRLCWQNAHAVVQGAALVVIGQENKLVLNHLMLLAPRHFKLAFWGHGANLQSDNPNGFKERFKRWTTYRVDWWFPYTKKSANLVTAVGFPDKRITVLNNAVDTAELHKLRHAVTPDETHALRESLGFGGGPVGAFVGSLYPDKRLDFLFAAAEAIRREVPDFHLLILGEGPKRGKVMAWCAAHPWARWVGARFGEEKAAYMSTAQVMLNPGALGLSVMDAFACQAPLITTDCGRHGPEISYLRNGINGVMTPDDLGAYVQASVRLLRDAEDLDTLRAGCAASAVEYTVENMACNFVEGVMRCLDFPMYRSRGNA